MADADTIEERLTRIESALEELVKAWKRWEPVLRQATEGPVAAWTAARRVRRGA